MCCCCAPESSCQTQCLWRFSSAEQGHLQGVLTCGFCSAILLTSQSVIAQLSSNKCALMLVPHYSPHMLIHGERYERRYSEFFIPISKQSSEAFQKAAPPADKVRFGINAISVLQRDHHINARRM